jgi:hypothetical protein
MTSMVVRDFHVLLSLFTGVSGASWVTAMVIIVALARRRRRHVRVRDAIAAPSTLRDDAITRPRPAIHCRPRPRDNVGMRLIYLARRGLVLRGQLSDALMLSLFLDTDDVCTRCFR